MEVLCSLVAGRTKRAFGRSSSGHDGADREGEHATPNPGRVFLRFLAAAVVTLLTALLAALVWLLGQAHVNDYCTTRAPQPPNLVGGRPAYMADPITVACEFDGHPTVYVTEPGPLLGALLLTAIVVAVVLGATHWARASAPGGAA